MLMKRALAAPVFMAATLLLAACVATPKPEGVFMDGPLFVGSKVKCNAGNIDLVRYEQGKEPVICAKGGWKPVPGLAAGGKKAAMIKPEDSFGVPNNIVMPGKFFVGPVPVCAEEYLNTARFEAGWLDVCTSKGWLQVQVIPGMDAAATANKKGK
ncbi:MAG: hypothetical protein GC131_08665 [Alphaproteobacteria bacterium]|nr:hypothetical protein [Alphaproteobacteria bacterium]